MTAQISSSCDDMEIRMSLKRKRNSTDDELEHMPPVKVTSQLEEELDGQPAQNVIVESSSCSSDDEGSQRSVYTDLDLNPDSFLSPPSVDNCVLSPLENVARGESTPHSNKRPNPNKPSCSTLPKRKCPLPGLSWADPVDLWNNMCEVDAHSMAQKNLNMFDNHPNLQPRMRTILLDWLNEVSEVYKLHRESFHLAVDYIDRYLTNMENVSKGKLQLIGITCLFIAAKVEEVYPPKIGEFAYVTDGACTSEEILLEELFILNILSWRITPLTINSWLNIYMQIASEGRSAQSRLVKESDAAASALRGYTFVIPQYSSLEFVVCGQLIDLAVLHLEVNMFPYSMIAAATMAHTFGKEVAVRVSGYSWSSIEPCHEWLAPFVTAVRAEGEVCIVRGGDGEYVQRVGGLDLICPGINTDESHRIQSHNVSLEMLDKVYKLIEEKQSTTQQMMPSTSQEPDHIYPPTPPQSDHKSPKTPTTKTPSTRQHAPPPDVRILTEERGVL